MEWSTWVNITASDYMSIAFINQVRDNTLHVYDLVATYLHSSPKNFDIDTNAGYQTQPLPEYLNLIERNLDYLQSAITWDVNRQASRTWLGEYDDVPAFSYRDVNRWFHDLLIMKLALDGIPGMWRTCGTFSCGKHYITQLIRR